MKTTAKITLSFLLIVSFGAGCQVPAVVKDVVKQSTAVPPPLHVDLPQWKSVGDGVERLEQSFSTSSQARLVVYRFPEGGFTLRFANADQPKRVSDWLSSSPNAVLAMNGVYFHEDLKPSGILIINNERIGTRAFDLAKSGFITLVPRLRIIDTSSEKVDTAAVRDGAQSYPFLIKDGAVAIGKDSAKYARRSFFGMDRDRRIYVGIVPDEPVSLYELAGMLARLDVSWDRVINMDGGPSSGIAFRSIISSEALDSYTVVPNVLFIEKK